MPDSILSTVHCKRRVLTKLIILTALSSTCFNNAGFFLFRRNIYVIHNDFIIQFFEFFYFFFLVPTKLPTMAFVPSVLMSMQQSHNIKILMKKTSNKEKTLLRLVKNENGQMKIYLHEKCLIIRIVQNVLNTASSATSIGSSKL